MPASCRDAFITTALKYHERTKHQFYRMANSLGYLDWKHQPNPFRTYEGASQLSLSLKLDTAAASLPAHRLFHADSTEPSELNASSIASFLRLSLGISAWKTNGADRWALRVNPSSGNLHPTSAYLLMPPTSGICDRSSVFHYNVYNHSLEQIKLTPSSICDHGFLLTLTSCYLRESWKYGERAFRYCNHDVGHAVACIAIAASLHGWRVTWPRELQTISHRDMHRALGLHQHKGKWGHMLSQDQADLMLYVDTQPDEQRRPSLSVAALSNGHSDVTYGSPNALADSGGIVDWRVIHQVHAATMHMQSENKTEQTPIPLARGGPLPLGDTRLTAAQIILQRRSCVSLDKVTGLTLFQFLQILDVTLPRSGSTVMNSSMWPRPRIDLLVFVHRVEGLEPGTYLLHRTAPEILKEYRSLLTPGRLEWHQPAPDELPELFFLRAGDLKDVAKNISCWQDIAADGAFSLGMIGDFRQWESARCYRELFWESGIIGQLLYLAAEAHGFRGTGMGCYMDDGVHALLGLVPFDEIMTGKEAFLDGLQDEPLPPHLPFGSIYHFTLGGAVDDPRLSLTPPYAHLNRELRTR